MSKPHRNSVRYASDEIKKLKDKTDYKKLDSMRDNNINYSDIPETGDVFWANAQVYGPDTKKAISFSLRVDPDILQLV